MENEYLTESQLCERLQVSRSTLWQLRNQKRLPHVRIGTSIRYRPAEIDRWLEENSHKNDPVTGPN